MTSNAANPTSSPAKTERAVFSMYCYWTGEATVGQVPGVVRTRIGSLGGNEVVEVEFDPTKTNVERLTQALKRRNSFYDVVSGNVRYTEEPKHSLRVVHPELLDLDLTEAQAIALNSWSHFGGPMPDVLTPEQKARLKAKKR
jgi:hypothetical protein